MVPCPIGGNAPDEVLPAVNREVLGGLDYFIVEDLRSARRFLSSVRIGRPIDTLEFALLNEHTSPVELEGMLKPLTDGRSAGVISEAGVPGVADPGADLVRLCHKKGIRVVPLTGPSSILLALMACGLNGQSFAFNGYLPIKSPDRERAIKFFERRAQTERQTQAFIETPYRNLKLYGDLLAVCTPQTQLTLAVNIQQPDEFIRTMTVGEWRSEPTPDMHKKPAVFLIL